MVRDSTVFFAIFGFMLSVFAIVMVLVRQTDSSTAPGIEEPLLVPLWLMGLGTLGFLVAGFTERKKEA